MIVSMTAAKIAISLPQAIVDRVRNEVEKGRASSVSAYVAEALAMRLDQRDLTSLLDEMLEASGGAMDADERRWADGVLGVDRATPA